MNYKRGNAVVWVIIVGLIVWGIVFLFSDDSNSTPSVNSYSTNSASAYQGYSNYDDSSGTVDEPENPYDEGTGHSAGYNWAEEHDVSDCGGNSQSFIEGCQEYVDQRDAYDDSGNDYNY